MTTSPAQAPPTPDAIPTLEDRAGQLAALGYTGRAAQWLALVGLHTGVFTRSQWCWFFGGANREAARVFVRQLIDKKLAMEDERAIFPGGARAVLLTGKPLYRALDVPDVRHRRGKDASTQVLMRRLLSLDYLIERPTLGWLPTETDKVQRLVALGIDRAVLPYRKYGDGAKGQPRYFALKLPIAVDDHVGDVCVRGRRAEPPIASCAHGARPTRRSGPHSGRGLSPSMSSPSAWAQRRQTAPRPC